MEGNGKAKDATTECSPSDCPGAVEFWDGSLTLLRTEFSFKSFGVADGSQGK